MESPGKSYHPRIRKMPPVGNNSLLAFSSLLLLFVIESGANNIGAKVAHTSWTYNNSRFDFIFTPKESISGLVRLESDGTNYLTKSLGSCSNHSACLLRDGKLLQAFRVNNTERDTSVYDSIDGTTERNLTSQISSSSACNNTTFTVRHYCSTNWNPPTHPYSSLCKHSIEWHSPLLCHSNSTSYEHPCYLYDGSGKLIDLTPWVLSNGSSYQVDIGVNASSVKSFNLNVCNEASSACGPNISSCLLDEKHGTIETGYNNLTSIKYDSKTKTVLLTQLGQFNQQCEDSRVKTIVHFICKNHVMAKSGPKLIRSSACENVVEWETVYACPTADIKVPATQCKIHYEPLKIDIDLRELARKSDIIEIPGIQTNGTTKKMIVGICQGLPRARKCGGKDTASISACLINSANETSPLNANNSEVIGSIKNSYIRYSDDRVYLEASSINKSCVIRSADQSVKITKQTGVRIEFFCSLKPEDKPVFTGFDDCTYTFEWGTRLLCFENLPTLSRLSLEQERKVDSDKRIDVASRSTTAAPRNAKTKLDEAPKTGQQMHSDTLGIAREFSKVHQQETKDKKDEPHAEPKSSNQQLPTKQSVAKLPQDKPQSKVNNWYKFFMISLIVMSLVSFVVIILILDKKTRLRVPLSAIRRQARQAFQPQPVPYSRVGAFNDCLDL